MYVYQQSESNLWTVGHYAGEEWIPESDHDSESDARNRVATLNGGTPPAATQPTSDPKPIKQQIPGLSKREYFAAMILAGIASKCIESGLKPQESALGALNLADALVTELENKPSYSPE